MLFLGTCMEARCFHFLSSTFFLFPPADPMLEYGLTHTAHLLVTIQMPPRGVHGTEYSSCSLHKQFLLIHPNLWAEMWLGTAKEPSLPLLLPPGRRKRHYFLLLEGTASSNYCPSPAQGHYQQQQQTWPWWKQSIRRGPGASAVLQQLAATNRSQLCSHTKPHWAQLSFSCLTASPNFLCNSSCVQSPQDPPANNY